MHVRLIKIQTNIPDCDKRSKDCNISFLFSPVMYSINSFCITWNHQHGNLPLLLAHVQKTSRSSRDAFRTIHWTKMSILKSLFFAIFEDRFPLVCAFFPLVLDNIMLDENPTVASLFSRPTYMRN